jgi:hypothetical protein
MNEESQSPLKALLEASANSPLSEADPKSLDELMERAQITFNTNPLSLSNEDLTTNVRYLARWVRDKKSHFAKLAKEKIEKDLLEPKKTRKKTVSISEALDMAKDIEI